ncbi:hypothetical protein CFC21_045032 [Triticum aestivum]|uniref:NB-ARC domain-containing protein n=1 Tax=Triticum aestivum TaxID=4565 RepID=A0A9R1FRH6_WHEAT|nr:hypothetical protein CFC21_045032 [Triticum aestivum]
MDAPDSDLHMEMEDPDLEAAMGFPVTASLGPVGPLLRQLRELTTLHNVVSGDEIQGLTEHLHGLCVSLMHQSEAEAEEPLNSTAKCWMREVRELCYDTNNYLNDAPFISKQDDDHGLTPQEKQENAQFEFKMLVARAKSASKRRQRCEINHKSISKTTKLSYTGRGLPVLHPELIDRGRMDELADMLGKDEEKQLKVVSLVGLEGVGKTTLAKRVYHKTVGQFQCRAFVRVSPNPDMRRLLTNILWQIQLPAFPSSSSSFSEGVTQPASCLDAQDLITNIQDYLRHKRCWSPGARRHRRRRLLHRRCLLLRAAHCRRPRVVRRIPGRRPAPLSICIPVCASHLMATCLTYVCTQILLLPLTRL